MKCSRCRQCQINLLLLLKRFRQFAARRGQPSVPSLHFASTGEASWKRRLHSFLNFGAGRGNVCRVAVRNRVQTADFLHMRAERVFQRATLRPQLAARRFEPLQFLLPLIGEKSVDSFFNSRRIRKAVSLLSRFLPAYFHGLGRIGPP